MRFGLLGAGCIGQLRAKALARIPTAKLIAVSDLDRAAAGRIAGPASARVEAGLNELLAADDIDAILVSTPPQFHEQAVLAALAAGKHVLCEKPLANSLEACRRMVAAARDRKKVLTTGFNHRYFPAIQFVKKAIADGSIGTLNHVRAFAGHEGLSQFRSASEYDRKVIGGGALLDVGIHLIDLTAYVLGDVREVFGVATGKVWNLPETEDNGFALLRNSAGAVATLHASWTEWKGYRFYLEAYGDRGMVRAYYAPMMHLLISMDKPGGTRRRSRSFYPMNILKEKLFGWQGTVVETFRQELTDFIGLASGGCPPAIADGFAGFRAVEIANAVYRSSAEQKTIPLTMPF
jgi:predicted dehydrogenase